MVLFGPALQFAPSGHGSAGMSRTGDSLNLTDSTALKFQENITECRGYQRDYVLGNFINVLKRYIFKHSFKKRTDIYSVIGSTL